MHSFQYNFDQKKLCRLLCNIFRKVKTNFKNCFQFSCESCLKSWKLPQFLKNLTILPLSCPNHLTKHNTKTLFPRLYTKKNSYWNEISFITINIKTKKKKKTAAFGEKYNCYQTHTLNSNFSWLNFCLL